MLLPHEIKKDNFSKTMMRGYSIVEVDEYIDFIAEKYSELYQENDELERKLKAALTKLDESRSDEDSVKNTIINARRAADRIIDEANERSDILVESAMNRCNAILSDFSAKIKKSREAILLMRKEVDAFKTSLYVKYNDHIEAIEHLTEFLYSTESMSSYTAQVIEGIKHDLEETISKNSDGFFDGEEDGADVADVAKKPDAEDYSEDFDGGSSAGASDAYGADDEDFAGGTPDGEFIPDENDYLYEDGEPFTHITDHSSDDADDDDDVKEFASHAKTSLFGRKNGQEQEGETGGGAEGDENPLDLNGEDEFELVYSNDDETPD